MACPHCGVSVPADAFRCPTCGVAVGGTPVALEDPQVVVTTGLPPGASVGTIGTTDDMRAIRGLSGLSGVDTGAPTMQSVSPGPGLGPLTVGHAFGPRYHIIRLLGTGGMGAVYQVWDAELGVAVALKVIRQDTCRGIVSPDAEKRFKSELLLARQVTHKNVVRIHDLGEIDGVKYITMPYVEGEDLASLLRREGKLPVARALRLMRQLADGLAAAHDAGVVHRDLKPANIMIGADDHALIMDFGISATASDAASDGLVGTPEYMAPEQGEAAAVDARADIYAFGLINYEMLTGPRTHVPSDRRLDAMRQRFEEGLPSPRTLDDSVSVAVDEFMMRCLERDPASRFQTSAEMRAALNRLNDAGEIIPEARRLTPRIMTAAAVVVAALLVGTSLVTRRAIEPPKAHDPVSVVLADFQNRTGDPAFDHTLEPMLKRALEGAGFVSAYDRNTVGLLGVRPGQTLDEAAARVLAVKQGLGVVLAGSIDRQGNGYTISAKATETVSGNVIASSNSYASSKELVLTTANRLMAVVRTALGDDVSESAQQFAMASLSSTSLDVVRYYAAAQEAGSNGKFEEALQNASKAVQLDPKFGIGYQLMAVNSGNLGRLDDRTRYINEALRYLDSMTERERYSTRAFFYRVTGDYPECVKEYGELIARYAADVVGHNQLALCASQLRDLRRARDEVRNVVEMLPNRALFRDNLALYSNYAGEFQAAEHEARKVGDTDAYAMLALAFAQLGQEQLPAARETYTKLEGMNATGTSLAASGLGDLAALEGLFSEASQILARGAAKDLATKNADRAAAKFAALAYADLSRGQKRAAADAAGQALANSAAVKIRFLAGRVFAETGAIDRVRELMAGLSRESQAEPKAYAKILEADIALNGGDARDAIKPLNDANALLDTWIGHFDLGRSYLAAGAFIQADSEFDRCLTRRGEALALFLDEEPTYAYLPPVYYYQGRVREALKTAAFADSYRTYLAFRGQSKDDPLVPDIRTRMTP